jgi:hypothetical protein
MAKLMSEQAANVVVTRVVHPPGIKRNSSEMNLCHIAPLTEIHHPDVMP